MAISVQQLPLQTARNRRALAGPYVQLGSAGLVALAFIVVCVLSILFLAQTGRVATRGYYLQALQTEEKTLKRQGEQFQYRIAAANRLDALQVRAVKAGLRPITPAQTRFITIELPAGTPAPR
ncbi:MAG: hypothetical protein NVS4B8_15130 [Herpetosiphon sp.]